MTARIWHPGIAADPLSGEGFAEVDDSAVPQLRQSGWLLASERDEHLERTTAHPSQNRDDDAGDGAGDPVPEGRPAARGTAKTDAAKTGGGKAGSAGSEGS